MTHSTTNGHAATTTSAPRPEAFEVRILRQDEPGGESYWQRHRIAYERDMNCISVLQKVAAQSKTIEGHQVAPVAWDCNCLEEVCGACTMIINGRVRQACTALVDRLLDDDPSEIELRPMTKFPVVRDLMVDRSRMFHALKRIKGWIPVDGYHDRGPGPPESPEQQQVRYPLSECMTCGCCLDACPQYGKIEVTQRDGESADEFAKRQQEAYDTGFLGAAAISQVVLFNSHQTGRLDARQRLDVLTDEGGIQVCGKAQNCVAVCPKGIPLFTSIARAARSATWHAIKTIFDR